MTENQEVGNINLKELNSIDAASFPLKAITYIATIIAFICSYLVQFLDAGTIAAGVGGGIAPMLLGGIVLGLFRLAKRFRNQRSSYKVFLVFQLVFVASSVSNLLKMYG